MRPRLLIVVTLAEAGGAQTYVKTLLPAVVGRYEVTVAAHGPGVLAAAAYAAGARYVELRHVRRDVSWRDAVGLLELLVLCIRARPQIVHTNSSKAGILGRIAAWLARVPVSVFTAHGWAFVQYSGRRAQVFLLAERAVRPLASRIVCVSERTRAAGIAAGTCTAQGSVVIPNAVVSDVPRAALVSERPRVVSVGRLKEPKDFATLIAALGRVHAPHSAAIIGDGPDRVTIESAARAAEVDLLGERDDVAAQLAASDVFVLSSLSEGMPMSVLEAMAAGLPVVASAVGGIPELVVEGETGFLVPPGDVDALAAALERVLSDVELRRRLGAAARRRVLERFSVTAFREAHLELYERELAKTAA